MNDEQQLKLQAFVDGELPEKEALEIAAWIARDAGATALARELRNTRQAIKSADMTVRLPESREFFWSKIRREIQRLETAPVPVRAESFAARFRRFLIPAGALAVAVAALLIAGQQSGLMTVSHHPDSEMAVSDPGTFTYQNYASGTTLVWLSYPAER